MPTIRTLALSTLLLLATSGAHGDDDVRAAVDAVLDDFHLAAAQADGERYFGHMTEDAVFLGTDASERWPKAAFEAFAKPYFGKGKGWVYVSRERHVEVESAGDLAWFDELLDSDAFGTCRGSGVLRRRDGVWRVAQYCLTFPVPNALAREVTGRIRAHARGLTKETTVYVVPISEDAQAADPAKRLARMLGSAALDAIYTTEHAHCRRIASVLATRLEAKTRAEDTAAGLAEHLSTVHGGEALLVVQHGAELTALLGALDIIDAESHAPATETVYVITLVPGGAPRVMQFHY